jgi:hypothetical protein
MRAIYQNPHAVYRVEAPPSAVSCLRDLVPGTFVHGLAAGRWVNVRSVWEAPDAEPLTCRVTVATPGAAWVEAYLRAQGITFDGTQRGDAAPVDRRDVSAFVREGRAVVGRLEREGWVRPGLASRVYDAQAELVGRIEAGVKSLLLVWPGGSGKTWAAYLAAFTAMSKDRSPIVCVVPSTVRIGWGRDAARITDTEIHVALPDTKGGGIGGLHSYLERMRAADRPPIIVVGQEHLAYWLPHLEVAAPGVVIFDEIDTIANRDLFKVRYLPDGSVDISYRETRGGKAVRGVAALELSMLPTVRTRIGLTATPLWNGVPEKLWPVSHLVWPGVFGFGFHAFGLRYCGGHVPDTGYGTVFDRPTNIVELKRRAQFFVHYVSYAESHGKLPPITYKVSPVAPSEQDASARFSEAMTWSQAFKAVAKGTVVTDDDGVSYGTASGGAVNTYELTLAHSCAVKRTAVVDRAVATALGGGRVIVAVGRISEARAWIAAIERDLSRRTPKASATTPRCWLMVGEGMSAEERMANLDAWAAHEGGAVGVITYQAMGAGVDGMQVADHAIIAMLPPTGRDLEQLIKRFDRANRTKNVLIEIMFAAGHRDEDHLKRQAANYAAFADFLGDANFKRVSDVLAPPKPIEEVVADFLSGII